MIFYVIAAICVALLAGVLYQTLGERRDLKRFPAPGKFVQVENRQVHVRDMGQGSPTVILESGLMSTVLAWNEIQPELAKSTRVISYDRAGLGWSDGGPEPRNASRLIDELHALLAEMKISPPYILVGHSFGGVTTPLFATRYAEEVAGVVLIDPVAPTEWNPPSEKDRKRAEIGSKVCRRASYLAHFGVLRLIVVMIQLGAKAFANRMIGTISKGAPSDSNTTESPWFWNLPAAERAMAPVFWTQAKCCRAIGSQLGNLAESCAQVLAAGPIEVPLVVISAANVSPERLKGHKAIAERAPRGRHIIAERSGHWVTEDQPELVIQSILKLVEAARGQSVEKLQSARGA